MSANYEIVYESKVSTRT